MSAQFQDNPPYNWKEVRVFISSTFRDFHAERDYLVKFVFPELREWCENWKLHLVDIDLRWGVTAQEAESGKAIDICLQEVDGCRPYFICMLGNRYGWVPNPKDIHENTKKSYKRILGKEDYSITHLEIYHAVVEPLNSEDTKESVSNAFFYFRDEKSIPNPETVNELTESEKIEFKKAFFNESSIETNKLKNLKETIIKHYENTSAEKKNPNEVNERIFTYFPRFDLMLSNPEDDKLKGRITGSSLKELGNRIIQDLKKSIGIKYKGRIKYFSKESEVKLTDSERDLEEELEQHKNFIEHRSQLFIGRDALLNQLLSYAESNSNNILAVFGETGSGKSALLAKFYKNYKVGSSGNEINKDVIFIPHFIGASTNSGSLYYLLMRFCRELFNKSLKQQMLFRLSQIKGESEESQKLKANIYKEYEIPFEINELATTFKSFLLKVKEHTIILIDALNQLDDRIGSHDLNWLPDQIPENIKIIVSTLSGKTKEVLEKNTKEYLLITPLTHEERTEIIHKLPSVFCKTLEKEHIDCILKKAGTDNPLYLKVALEELRIFGSFEKLKSKIEELPDNIIDLYVYMIDRIENDHFNTHKIVEKFFSILACSKNGLALNELKELFKDDTDNVHFAIMRQIRPYLINRENVIDFFHTALLEGVKKKYLENKQYIKWHNLLAYYFQEKADPNDNKTWQGDYARAFLNLPYHLLMAEDINGITQLVKTNFLERKAKIIGDIDALSDARKVAEVLAEAGDDYSGDLMDCAYRYCNLFEKINNLPDQIESLAKSGDINKLNVIVESEYDEGKKGLLMISIAEILKVNNHNKFSVTFINKAAPILYKYLAEYNENQRRLIYSILDLVDIIYIHILPSIKLILSDNKAKQLLEINDQTLTSDCDKNIEVKNKIQKILINGEIQKIMYFINLHNNNNATKGFFMFCISVMLDHYNHNQISQGFRKQSLELLQATKQYDTDKILFASINDEILMNFIETQQEAANNGLNDESIDLVEKYLRFDGANSSKNITKKANEPLLFQIPIKQLIKSFDEESDIKDIVFFLLGSGCFIIIVIAFIIFFKQNFSDLHLTSFLIISVIFLISLIQFYPSISKPKLKNSKIKILKRTYSLIPDRLHDFKIGKQKSILTKAIRCYSLTKPLLQKANEDDFKNTIIFISYKRFQLCNNYVEIYNLVSLIKKEDIELLQGLDLFLNEKDIHWKKEFFLNLRSYQIKYWVFGKFIRHLYQINDSELFNLYLDNYKPEDYKDYIIKYLKDIDKVFLSRLLITYKVAQREYGAKISDLKNSVLGKLKYSLLILRYPVNLSEQVYNIVISSIYLPTRYLLLIFLFSAVFVSVAIFRIFALMMSYLLLYYRQKMLNKGNNYQNIEKSNQIIKETEFISHLDRKIHIQNIAFHILSFKGISNKVLEVFDINKINSTIRILLKKKLLPDLNKLILDVLNNRRLLDEIKKIKNDHKPHQLDVSGKRSQTKWFQPVPLNKYFWIFLCLSTVFILLLKLLVNTLIPDISIYFHHLFSLRFIVIVTAISSLYFIFFRSFRMSSMANYAAKNFVFLYFYILLFLFIGATFCFIFPSWHFYMGNFNNGGGALFKLFFCYFLVVFLFIPELVTRWYGLYTIFPTKRQLWIHRLIGVCAIFAIWIAISSLIILIIPNNFEYKRNIKISSDNKFLITRSDDNTIKRWNISLQSVEKSIETKSSPNNEIDLVDENKYLLINCFDSLKLVDLDNFKTVYALKAHNNVILNCALTDDHKYAFTSTNDGIIYKWDMIHGKNIASFNCKSKPIASLYIYNKERIIFCISRSKINSYNIDNMREVNDFYFKKIKGNNLIINNDQLITLNTRRYEKRGQINVYNIFSKERVHSFKESGIISFLVTNKSNKIIIASKNKTLKVWDLKAGKELCTMKGYEPYSEIVVSADDRYVYAVGKGHCIKCWDLEKQIELPPWEP